MTNQHQRAPRGMRRGRIRLDLTRRDRAILAAVARFRLCRSSDLARLFFGAASRTRAAQRLRSLFGAGYLYVRVEHLAEENLHSLGELGRAWARSQGLTIGRVPSGRIGHHLDVVRAWSTLAAVLGPHNQIRLARVRPDWELREAEGHLVVPDLLVELSAAGRRLAVAVEVDRGTERTRAWQDKLARYSAVHADREVLLVVIAAPLAVPALERLAKRAWLGRVLLVAKADWPELFIRRAEALLTDPSCSKKGEEAASA